MQKFTNQIEIIGVNHYVFLLDDVLNSIFKKAKKTKGPIQVKGKLNDHAFIQTLVKYSGKWRLYLNTPMRKAAKIEIEFDPKIRTIQMHPKLLTALLENKKGQQNYDEKSPSKQKEIIRYITSPKAEESVDRNIKRVIEFLIGKSRFEGRDKP